MTVKIGRSVSYTGNADDGIGTNSMDLTGGMFFVTKTNEFVAKATAGSYLSGVSLTQKLFASDNQTVAKERVLFIPRQVDSTYIVTITGGTITVADEGKYYNLSDAVTVDGATEATVPKYTNTSDAGGATDPLITMQLQLVKFITATLGEFRIVV